MILKYLHLTDQIPLLRFQKLRDSNPAARCAKKHRAAVLLHLDPVGIAFL